MITLTTKEAQALELCLNYEDREGQLSDNYSNGGKEEFARAFGWNKQQVGGVMASLIEKGLGVTDEENPDMFWLSDEGVNAIFDHLESQSESQEKAAMSAPKFEEMTMKQLVEAYNGHPDCPKPVKKFSTRNTGVSRCEKLFGDIAPTTTKPKAPKKPKTKGGKTGRAPKYPLDTVIASVIPNPKRPKSAAGQRYNLMKAGMTVDAFYKAGGWTADINHDVKKGFITLRLSSGATIDADTSTGQSKLV